MCTTSQTTPTPTRNPHHGIVPRLCCWRPGYRFIPPIQQPAYELPTAVITTRTPYDEDDIAEIITKIYRVLVELCYISAEDIIWPPSADGHVINEQLCRKLRLSPTVISLMKKIPYPKDIDYACRMELFPYSNPYAGETRSGCDPLWLRP